MLTKDVQYNRLSGWQKGVPVWGGAAQCGSINWDVSFITLAEEPIRVVGTQFGSPSEPGNEP
jgi:hypothetical protein